MSIYVAAVGVLNQRTRTAQMMDISGVGHWHLINKEFCDDEECCGLDPLIELEQEIKLVQELIEETRNHKHQWNENGFCDCGWDGNA